MNSTPTAVIFDLDGCLVDSETLSIDAIVDELSAMGRSDVTFEKIRERFLGVSMPVICKELTQSTDKIDQQGFVDRAEARLFSVYPDILRRIDGVVEMLSALKNKGVTMAVATGGSVRRMNETLAISGLAPWFENLAFSADQVKKGKPAPDLFLHAAKKMKLPPQNCVVFEDSPNGVQGAVTAGMRAVGFIGGSHLSGMRNEHAELLTTKGAETVVGVLDDAIDALLSPKGRHRT